jgi:hypothetical protein
MNFIFLFILIKESGKLNFKKNLIIIYFIKNKNILYR